MTRDRPTGAELLVIAREMLQREIVPSLTPERRLLGLMIANALAIAEREAADSGAMLRREAEGLAAFYGEPAPRGDEASIEAELLRLNRRLAGELRAGTHPGDARVHAHLLRAAEARVAVSNPKLLGRP